MMNTNCGKNLFHGRINREFREISGDVLKKNGEHKSQMQCRYHLDCWWSQQTEGWALHSTDEAMKKRNVGDPSPKSLRISRQWQRNLYKAGGPVGQPSSHVHDSSSGPWKRNQLEACNTGCGPSSEPFHEPRTVKESQRYKQVTGADGEFSCGQLQRWMWKIKDWLKNLKRMMCLHWTIMTKW